MIDFSALNWPAILVAAVAAFVLGFLWHGPVFGKQWVKLMKITPAEMKKGMKEMQGKMQYYMGGALVMQFITATAISLLCTATGVTTATNALELGVLLWLGLIATTLMNGVLWEKRTVPLYLFNITYQLVSIVMVTLIVGLWI